MPRDGIRIPNEAAALSVRMAPVRVTYPRLRRLLPGLVALAIGLGVWLWQLPPRAWEEPLQYAFVALLLAPGLWGLWRGLEPRPVVTARGPDLVVRYGPAFAERVVARLPLDRLEVRISAEPAQAVCYDSSALSRRLLAAAAPLMSGKLPSEQAKLYVLAVRSRGQSEWLGLFGSRVASEVENARLALLAATDPEAEVEAMEDEEAEDDGVSPGPESR
jgi:hypothetical protein